jgi:hypothetical protein
MKYRFVILLLRAQRFVEREIAKNRKQTAGEKKFIITAQKMSTLLRNRDTIPSLLHRDRWF